MSGQVTITQLPTASALTGQEPVPIVQNGVTVQTTTGAIAGAGALNYPFLTVGSTAGLTQARYLATGTGLSLTDNGAGSTLQVNLTGTALSLDNASTGFIVKNSASTVINRLLTVGQGMTIANADGISANPLIGLNTNLTNLSSLTGTGLMTINGSTFSQTTIVGTTNQISIANGNAVGGSPTVSISNDPVLPGTGGAQVPSGSNAQRLANNGVIRYNTDSSRFEFYQNNAWATIGTGDGTVTNVQGTVNQIAVINGTTVPVISIAPNPTLPGTNFVQLPIGTTAQRGTPAYGAFRYNTDTGALEVYTNTGWSTVSAGTGVVTFSGGTTGLTPNTPTAGGIILAGILNPSNGGTGINNGSYTTTLGGNVSFGGAFTTTGTGSLTLAVTATTSLTLPTAGTLATLAGTETLTNKSMSGSSNTFTNIPNSALTNSSVTYNGVTVALGASGTITANTTNALTVSTGLQLDSGTTFNGSVARTISIDSTVATLTGTQTLTNKSMSGSTNTFTNIPNSALTNNSITIGTTTVALGGTTLTPAGLTSVTVTQDPVSSLQLATKQYVDSVAQGLDAKASVRNASTVAFTATYSNGTAGVGATLTNSSTLVAFSADGVTNSVGDRVLIKNQASALQNGIYTVTTAGSGSVAWVLTRATDMDTWAEVPNSFVFVEDGSTQADTGWVCTSNAGGTMGTTAITWVQFSGAGTYTAGTGLTLTGTQFSLTAPVTTALGGTGITTNPTAGAIVYGATTSTLGYTAIGTSGQPLLSAGAGTPTFGTLSVGGGGTGLTTGVSGGIPYFSSTTAMTSSALLVANALMVGGGAGVAPSTVTTGTGVVTALGVNTGSAGAFVVNGGALGTPSSGTLTNATGLPVSTGISGLGTGVASALAVNVGTAGAFVVNGGALGTPSSGTVTNLTGTASININGTVGATTANTGAFTTISATGVITSTVATGTAPFTVASTTTVANLGATNTVNTGITLTTTGATNYLTFVTATSGNLPQLVNSSITANAVNGTITGGIAGGAF